MDFKFTGDTEVDRATLDSAISCLNALEKTPAKITNTKQGFDAVSFIYELVRYGVLSEFNETPDQIFLKSNKHFYELLSDALNHLISNRSDLKLEAGAAQKDEEKWQLSVFCSLLRIINQVQPVSNELRSVLGRKERLKFFFDLLGDEIFLKRLDTNKFDLIGHIVFNVNWISKNAESNKLDWQAMGCVDKSLDFLRRHPAYHTYIYMIIANIATDKQIEELRMIHELVDHFINWLNKCIESVHELTNVFHDDEFNLTEECVISAAMDDNLQALVSVTGVLLALYKLSVNDQVRERIYSRLRQGDDPLKGLFIEEESEIVKQYTAQVLAQLCFNEKVLALVAADHDLCEHIRSLSNAGGTVKWRKLVKNCQQIEWLLQRPKEKQTESNETPRAESQHIMISYNTGSREMCLKIKDALESRGHKVWIDVSEIHGSSLDSMAKAVEGAKCVLMCVSEKYRQSVNCQAEAQYAFRLNKVIIPLIMQAGYHNVTGWLGIIMGDKIFVDFTKYEFNESLNRLFNQVNLTTGQRKEAKAAIVAPHALQSTPALVNPAMVKVEAQPPQPASIVNLIIKAGENNTPVDKKQAKMKAVQGWRPEQVLEWLEKSSVDKSIQNYLKPCTGELLSQLYQIQTYTPEFFFKSLSQIGEVDMKAIANFSSALKRLFDEP